MQSLFPTSLSEFLPKSDLFFDDYFTKASQLEPLPDADVVTDSEFGQYVHILCNKVALDVDEFRSGKEEQIAAFLLRELAGEFKCRNDKQTTTL
jgi:hypothetical protein